MNPVKAELQHILLLLLLSNYILCAGRGSDEDDDEEKDDKEGGEDYITSDTDSEDMEGKSDPHHAFKRGEPPQKESRTNPGRGQPQMAFLFKMKDCSASLIHKDWILTAVHCITELLDAKTRDENGDLVVNINPMVSLPDGGGATLKPTWIEPVQIDIHSNETHENRWRKVIKVYMQDYKGEKRLYEGNDLLLLKLAPEVERMQLNNTFIAPVCLPDPDKPDLESDLSDQLFFFGQGRRRIPHCITDDQGPDQFNICGRPVGCSKNHRATQCGLEFLYKGEVRRECLKIDTPSSEDPVCRKLLRLLDDPSDFKNQTFVFTKEGKYRTTCYPFKVKLNSKGWCSTRAPWEDQNSEPKFDSGWGFCGEDEIQSQCDKQIDRNMDTSLFRVSRLKNSYCFKQLKLNLDVELPGTPESAYKDLDAHGLICVGKNVTHFPEEYIAYINDEDSFIRIKLNDTSLEALRAANRSAFNAIDGGSCFGDSGGPLIKYVLGKPVLVGVMSFLLWGTCKSQFDPSYYTRVHKNMDFILKHLPKDEICFA